MSEIRFRIRWREELETVSDEGTLIFELTMGKLHLYFPDQTRWRTSVPGWACEKWEFYLESCTTWCKENRIPMTVVPDALVYEEKNKS